MNTGGADAGDCDSIVVVVTSDGGIEIEWVTLPPDSRMVGRSLSDARFRRTTGASVVAVRKADGIHPNPSPDYTFQTGDQLGILGTEEQRRTARGLIDRSTRGEPV